MVGSHPTPDLNAAVHRQFGLRATHNLHRVGELNRLKSETQFTFVQPMNITFQNDLIHSSRTLTRRFRHDLPGLQNPVTPLHAGSYFLPQNQPHR